MSKKKAMIMVVVAVFLIVTILTIVIVINNTDKEDSPIENNEGNPLVTGMVPESETKQNNGSEEQGQIDNGHKPEPTAVEKTDISESDSKTSEVSVTLGAYKGLEVSYNPTEITDEDIDDIIKNIQNEFTEIVELPDRAFKEGDMAIVTYEGQIDGKRIDKLCVVCLQVIIGKGILPKEIESKIIGQKKGDSFTVDVKYPDDFTDIEEVAGKTVSFSIDLVDGFTFYIPDIDDTFIKEHSTYSSLNEYRSAEKERLQNEENERSREIFNNEIKKLVVDNCTYSDNISDEIKKEYVKRLSAENTEYMDNYWMDVDTYYQLMYGYEPGQYTRMLMESVSLDVKYSYALSEIAKQENITTEEAEKLIFDSAVAKGLEG